MLAAGKGWVLPVLAMLAAKGRLRVAARGSGPGAKRRRPCPPLRAASWGGCRDEGRPATTTPQEALPGRASNKGLTSRGGPPDSPSPSYPAASMGQKAAQEAAEAVSGIGRSPTTSRPPKGLLRPPERLAPLAA